jgi:hypothetical protein
MLAPQSRCKHDTSKPNDFSQLQQGESPLLAFRQLERDNASFPQWSSDRTRSMFATRLSRLLILGTMSLLAMLWDNWGEAAEPVVNPVAATATEAAAEAVAKTEGGENWPQEVVVTVGELRTRIDGPKLWTLSGIEFQDTVMATQDSAYGSVLTIRNVGLLGTAHFLDVPGKPGQVEKERVNHLQLLVDGTRVAEFAPTMSLTGQSFRMERKSRIRTMELETLVSIQDGVLTETASLRATAPLDLRVAYPWMYAFTPQAKAYLFGDDDGIRKRGTFLAEGKAASQVVPNMTWVAVFNPDAGKGSVCCFLEHPPKAEASFLLVDAPGSYRKVAAYTLVDTVVPTGFTGTYRSAVGCFEAAESDWEQRAMKRAAEIRAASADR